MDATAAAKGAKRKQVTRTLDSLAEVRALVAQVRSDVERNGVHRVETMADLCGRWLDSRRDVRQVTREGYRHVLTPALRYLGGCDVRKVGLRDVEGLITWLIAEGGRNGTPLGPRSVRATLTALAQCFDMAAREGAIASNPVRLARRPRQRVLRGTDLEHWQPENLIRFRRHADAATSGLPRGA